MYITKFMSHRDSGILNKLSVIKFIRLNGPVSRTKIWESMELSRASVTQIIKQLQDQGLVFETEKGESRGGRKPTFIEFNENYKLMIIFDWDSKKLSLVNLGTEVLYSMKIEVDVGTTPQEFVLKVANAVQQIRETRNISSEQILGIGMIMAGVIDPNNGIVIFSAVQKWENVDVKGMMEKETGLNVVVDTDTNMQALGECHYGIGNGVKNFVLVGVEEDGLETSGLGTALVLNGELIRGNNHMSGEIGHVRISREGPLCLCGNRGCLEAMIKDAVRRNQGSWLGEAAEYIGMAVGMIVNILDPGTIVLNGGMIDQYGDRIVREIRAACSESVLKSLRRELRIEKSLLGNDAAMKGMSSLLYRIHFEENFKEIGNWAI